MSKARVENLPKIDFGGRTRGDARIRLYLVQREKGSLMRTGAVKFYNEQRGYGFIAPDDGGKDVFVHATALERAGLRTLTEGQKVSFDTAEDRRSGKIAVDTIQAG